MSMIRSMIRGSGTSGDAFSEWQSITTESGSSPSSTAFTLSSDQDGFILYVNDLLEDRPGGLLKFTIEVDSTAYTLVAAPYQSYLFHCGDAGESVKIACEEMDGTGVEYSVSICKARMPLQYVDTDALFVTGTVHSDWNYPLGWNPTTYRVTMQADGQWLAIDGTSWTKQTIVWIRERSGSNISPAQAVICVPGRITPFFVQGREVAVMTLDGIDVPIQAPFDTYVDTMSASDVLDIDDFTPVRTVNVSTGGEFDAAIADLTDGDDIVVTGNITASNISMTNLAKSFRVRGSTGDPDDTVITGEFSIGGSSSTEVTLYMSGVSWAKNTNNVVAYSYLVNWRLTRCKFAKLGGTAKNVWEWNNGGGSALYSRSMKAFRCEATGSTAAWAEDVWNFRMPAAGSAHLIACKGSVAGGAASNNLVTNHNENGGTYVWGGEYSDPSTSGPAITSDSGASPLSLIGVYCHDGATSNGFKVGAFPLTMVFGCEIRDLGDGSNCLNFYRCIGNRITTGGANQNYAIIADDTDVISFVGNIVLHPNNTGTFLYVQSNYWIIAGNQFRLTTGIDTGDDAFSRSWDIRVESVFSSGDPGVQWCLLNYARSASSCFWRDVDNTGVAYCVGNIATSLDGSPSTTDVKNMVTDGNLTTGSLGGYIAAETTNARNSITPIRNNSTEAMEVSTEFSADGTPLSGGQLEWATFASGLSGANQTTLRGRLPFDLGLMDAFGGSLVDHLDRFTLGPVQIRERVDAVGLYPARG